jgi:hypothetical protein
LCINQSDDVEKSWQVQQMHAVYASAERTPIFLGPKDDHSDAAIELLQKTGQEALEYRCLGDGTWDSYYDIAQQFVHKHLNNELEESTHSTTIEPAEQLLHRIMSPKFNHDYMPFHQVSSIMDRPWWCRVWVLQELVVSQNPVFLCGHKQIHADLLVASINLFAILGAIWVDLRNAFDEGRHPYLGIIADRYLETPPPRSFPELPAILLYTKRLTSQEFRSYVELIWMTQCSSMRMQATNPRDHIFPLMILTDSNISKTIQNQLDYSLPVATVYLQATADLLRAAYLGIFRLAVERCSDSKIEGMPSWAPDWSGTRGAHNALVVQAQLDEEEKKEYAGEFDDYVCPQEGVHVLSTLSYEYGQVVAIQNAETFTFSSSIDEEEENPDLLAYWSRVGTLLLRIDEVSEGPTPRITAMAMSINLVDQDMSRLQPDPDEENLYDRILKRPEFRHELSERSIWNVTVFLAQILAGKTRHDLVDTWEQLRSQVAQDFPATRGLSYQKVLRFLKSNEPDTDIAEKKAKALQSIELADAKEMTWFWATRQLRIVQGYTPFVCGEYVGVSTANVQSGDTLADFKCDPESQFILRPFGKGLFKIVGLAYVIQLWEYGEDWDYPETTIKLC